MWDSIPLCVKDDTTDKWYKRLRGDEIIASGGTGSRTGETGVSGSARRVPGVSRVFAYRSLRSRIRVQDVTGMETSRIVRGLFFALLLFAFAYPTALIVEPFLTYILAAFLLAFLFWPLHQWLAPRVGNGVSAFALVVTAVTLVGAALGMLVLSLPTDAAALSRAIEETLMQTRFEQRFEQITGVKVPLQSTLAGLPRRIADMVVGDIPELISAATDAFLGTVLLLFLFYYLLKDGETFVAWIRQTLPLGADTTEELLSSASTTTWAVLKGHVFIAVIQGIVAGIGLLVVGISNVVFWTMVMMFLELFPVVGVAGVLAPTALYLAFTDRLLASGFIVVYGLTAVAVVDDYLRALVVDRESALHSAAVIVGVFGGVYAFGVMGLFYGPVVLGLFQALIRLFRENYVEEEAGDTGNGESHGE